MNYPLISEYIEAIKAAEENFDELKNLRPVLDEDGEPVMTSGNFAVVFKMKDEQTGKLHAVKCFLKEQEGRAEAYRMIAEELEYVNSTFLTPIKYLDKELFVDSKNSDETEFPVLLMDWVEGQTLDKYIQKYVCNYQRAENLDETTESEEKAVELLANGYELEKIAYQFSCLAIWLLQQPFAHGDLKPDNIIVKEDGTLVLVDYDGMYVPAMKGQKARELGSPDFRHPLRSENDFDERIDDFPLSSILLSLLAIANEPSLLEKYGGDGRLLLSERDYRNIAESVVLDALRPLMADKNLTTYLSLFYLCSAQKSLFKGSYHLFTLPELDKPSFMLEEESLSTEVTEEDLSNAWVDEYGVKYSADKKRLLLIPDNIIDYKTRKGATVICDYAFGNPNVGGRIKNNLKYLFISADVKIISSGTLFGSQHLSQILVDENNSVFDSRNNCNAIIRTKNNELLLGCQTTIIPNNVLSIAHTAFLSCVGLKMIHIPDSVISIGEEAFMNCSNLSQIHLPSSVKEIGSRAFNGCAIEKVTIDKENCIYDTRNFCNAIISSLDNCMVFGCKTTTIPETVACIGNKAFECCELKDIYFPNSVKTIEPSAFVFCTELQSIYFSSGLNYIGRWAFGGCKSLTSIIFEDVVKYIDSEAFFGCDAIKKIVVPIGTKGKFEKLLPQYYKDKIVEHDKEETLSAEVTEEDLSKAWTDEYGVKYSKDRKRLLKAPKDLEYYTIRKGTKVICSEAFSEICHYNVWEPTFWGYGSYQHREECKGSELVSINIPDSVEIIGASAFRGSKLSSLYIPNSVKTIGYSAFEECYSLKFVVIPVNTISIGNEAFRKCYSLSLVSLPNAIEKIGRNAFSCCDQLNSITIPISGRSKFEKLLPDLKDKLIEQDAEENLSTEVTDGDLADAWTDTYGVKYSADKKRLLKAPNEIKDYSVLAGTIVICNDAFRNCKQLISIIISDSVKTIGKRAFFNCSNISLVKMPDSIRQIKSRAFFCCYSLTSVFIPQNVVEIGEESFTGCINLTSIEVHRNNKIYDSRNNCNAIIETYGNSVVLGCSSTRIPKDIIRIGKQAFYGCENLHTIVMPDNVIDIEFAAFAGCVNLESITMPNMVEEIAQASFLGCKKLKTINLPESLTVMGNRVFYECTNLKEISLPKSLNKIGQDIFSGCISLKQILIPIGSKEKFLLLLPDFSDKLIEQECGWTVKDTRLFDPEEIALVKRAEVVASQYGNSVCFFMQAGSQTYIPLCESSSLSVGDSFDLKTAKIITLYREGKDDIVRVIE